MADQRNSIQRKFQETNRYPVFKDAIMRISARGFRCHLDTIVDIRSPITAFCGLNGTGKSTLLQLAATAFRSPDREQYSQFNVSDFLTVGALDPAPFKPDAQVEYRYWQSNAKLKTTTLTYNQLSRRWSGYANRPLRRVFFTGVGHYLPRIEQRDFVVRHASQLSVLDSQPVPQTVQDWTSRILSSSYKKISDNTVEYLRNKRQHTSQVLVAERYGSTYSESHMGFGEGRTMHLVSALESLPERSLILIEEPETSLHPSAQHELGRYLVNVVDRKHHQIFLTTHSMFLLTSLPLESIIYLNRIQNGIESRWNMSPLEVRSLLADGHVKAIHILVEDDCAKTILREIIRRIDANFLQVVEVQEGGDAGRISATVRTLASTSVPIACVCDGDQEPSPSENVFCLPGTQPPEKEIFTNPYVRSYLEETYSVNMEDFDVTLSDIDHHDWLRRLADRLGHSRNALLSEMAREYSRSLSETEVASLIDQLKAVAQ